MSADLSRYNQMFSLVRASRLQEGVLSRAHRSFAKGISMPGLRPYNRNGIFYAIGTVAGERIRQSLGTRDRRQAQELCAQYEAKLWKRRSYGEESVRTFEEAVMLYVNA